VAKGRAAREIRYEAAVRRQLFMVTTAAAGGARYLYAAADEFVRRGDSLDRFVRPDLLLHGFSPFVFTGPDGSRQEADWCAYGTLIAALSDDGVGFCGEVAGHPAHEPAGRPPT
jgi:hypothetical protein